MDKFQQIIDNIKADINKKTGKDITIDLQNIARLSKKNRTPSLKPTEWDINGNIVGYTLFMPNVEMGGGLLVQLG